KAVGAGLNLFITNIADHLKTGVVSWLLGTAVKAGLDLPAKFDLKGIIQLIGSMLGLTWDNIRTRVTRKGVPDEAMSAVETSVPVAKNLAAEGPAGAVKEIQAEAGDLKATILGKLTTYLIPTVLIAGITWIISLLNPASAFVRAVKGIIDIVTFIVTQGAQIADFVNAVLDAVIAIANGGQAGVPKLIETALATSIPLLIGFLAALLGIGGLANKVKSVFQSVSRPVTRAIDKIADFITKKGKALWNKIRSKSKNKEEKEDKRKENYHPHNRKDEPQAAFSTKRNLSMTGEPHELRTTYRNGDISTSLASAKAKDILGIVDKEIRERQKILELDPDDKRTKEIVADLSTLRPKYDQEMARCRSISDKSKIREAVEKLNDEVASWVISIANKYTLTDFIRKALGLEQPIERIRTQVEDQLEKHVNDPPNPRNPGDGHANTATAAEDYLEWVHHTDQFHRQKTTTAKTVIESSLAELEEMGRLGLNLSSIAMYQRGKKAAADCDLALTDPKAYLEAKKQSMDDFIKDIKYQRSQGRQIGASWIT
ncbi:hypothetical protein ACH5AP_14805, partial [Streptomyces anulatus]